MSGPSNPSQQQFGQYFFSIHPVIIRMSTQLYGQPLRLKKEEKLLPIYRLAARMKKDAGKNEVRYIPPTLATLPPDIIRIIVELSAEPNRLRGISRSWNSIVLEGRHIPLDGLQLVVKDNDSITVNLRIFKEFLHYFGPEMRETAKIDELNEKLLNVESVRPLHTFKLSSDLKHICRIKSVWLENVDWRTIDLLIGSIGSIPIERLTVRAKKDAGKNEFKYITEQAAKVKARHRVIV